MSLLKPYFENFLGQLHQQKDETPQFQLIISLTFIVLFFTRFLFQLLLNQCFVKRKPEPSHPLLQRAYELARPTLPEPNELVDLSKATEKTIEELNAWFRAARQQDRSIVKCQRLGEALWRFLILLTSVLSVVAVHNKYLPDWKAQLIRTCLHSHLLLLHLISVRQIPFVEFIVVAGDIATRACLVSVFDSRLGEIIAVTHDSVDCLLEFSKSLDFLGFSNIAKIVFLIFTCAWAYLKLYVFPLFIYHMGWFRLRTSPEELPVKAAILAQVAFDAFGFWTLLSIAKQGFWSTNAPTRRQNRGDSLSSATSQDYESDSSLSSNLRDYKDD
jgi:hypothetical protein